MKSFSKLYSDFWINYDNSGIIKLGADVQLMALYLQSNSHHNILGVYYLPLLYISNDLKFPVKQVQIILNKLCKINYCKYDKETQYVWVYNLAHEQIGEHIDIKDNRIKSLHAVWSSLPSKLEFLEEIYQKYKTAFHLKARILEKPLDLKLYAAKKTKETIGAERIKDTEETKGTEKTKKPKKVDTNINATDVCNVSLDIFPSKDTNIGITTNINPNISIGVNEHTVLDTRPYTDEDTSALLAPPFEAPSKSPKVKNEGVSSKENFESGLIATTSKPSQEFINDDFDAETFPITDIVCKKLPGTGAIKEDSSVSTPLKGILTPFEASSEPLEHPFEAPLKALRSPSEDPSDPLRSNIEYRIKNIDYINKKIERRKEKKEKTKKRDIYLNHTPTLNIVAQARPCQVDIENSFEFNSLALRPPSFAQLTQPATFDQFAQSSQFGLSAQPSHLSTQVVPAMSLKTANIPAITEKAVMAKITGTVESMEITSPTEITKISDSESGMVNHAENKAGNNAIQAKEAGKTKEITCSEPITTVCKSDSFLPVFIAIAAKEESQINQIMAGVNLESDTVAKNLPSKEIKVADSVIVDTPITSAFSEISTLDIFDHSDDSTNPSHMSLVESATNQVKLPQPLPKASDDAIVTIFEHWKNTMQHPKARLDCKRRGFIRRALCDGYSVEDLCDAITGCSITPHNIGQNDRGQRYDGLHVLLRDADQIDRFIHNYHHPPRPVTAAHQRLQANILELNPTSGFFKKKQ